MRVLLRAQRVQALASLLGLEQPVALGLPPADVEVGVVLQLARMQLLALADGVEDLPRDEVLLLLAVDDLRLVLLHDDLHGGLRLAQVREAQCRLPALDVAVERALLGGRLREVQLRVLRVQLEVLLGEQLRLGEVVVRLLGRLPTEVEVLTVVELSAQRLGHFLSLSCACA